MRRLREFLYWVAALDPSLTWDQRTSRWANIATIAGPVITLFAGLIGGWLLNNAWIGLVVGLALWNLALNGILALGRHATSTRIRASATTLASDAEDSSLPYPRPRPLPPDALSKPHLSDRAFRVVDLFTPEDMLRGAIIQDKVFENCTFHGPGILAPSTRVRFTFCKFVAEPDFVGNFDPMIYEIPPERANAGYVGVIGIERSVFRRCTFVDIGLIGKPGPGGIQDFKKGMGGEADMIFGPE